MPSRDGRVGRVTASRVPKILGLSPHGTAETVMREMVREQLGAPPDPGSTWATGYGNDNELTALRAYEKARDVIAWKVGSAQETVVHPSLDWLAATPDGLVDLNGLVELKCPRAAVYSHVSQRPDIEAQIQTQLSCLRRLWGDLCVWRRGQPPLISTVDYDPTWLGKPAGDGQPSRLDVLREFYERFLMIVDDPKLSAPYLEPLVNVRYDAAWAEAARDYLDVSYDVEQAQLAKKAAERALAELAAGKKTRGCGVSYSRSTVKGRINYSQLVEKYAPDADVEHFRGEDTTRDNFRKVTDR